MDTSVFTGLVDYLFRWGHFLFGITWIGMLYYFNFVQGEYFKEAEPSAKGDAVKKLAPRALWWFRWGAAGTFLTGLALFSTMNHAYANLYIYAGMLMGTLMFLNVWLIIWPAQKIVCGIVEGDAAKAGPKALLASRTNTLFSAPMLFFMGASAHLGGKGGMPLMDNLTSIGFIGVFALIIALEANAIVGKIGPMASVKGIVHCSLALAVVMFALTMF